MWPSSLPPGARSFQYIQRQRILQGRIYWHSYWKVNKIEVINIYSTTYCKWSRGERSVVTKLIKIERWDCFSLQVPRTLFRSKAPFGSCYQAVSSILQCYLQIHQMTWDLAHSFPFTPCLPCFWVVSRSMWATVPKPWILGFLIYLISVTSTLIYLEPDIARTVPTLRS